ncbi:MAG TPA: tripartite tricarboxylate transporter TctB family protein [Devosia sp.]|jgi:putative tricarboxylic transport membrane protein|nr:tripartite tricarboxylate transporter TctB family protein [Devosia sp.]
MSQSRNKNMVIGLAMLAAGLAYLVLIAGLPRRGTIDATFMPYFLAGGMVLLGVLQVVFAGLAPKPAGSVAHGDVQRANRPSYRTVALTLALIAGFTALLRPIGFPFAAALYLFLQFVVLTPPDQKPSFGLYALLAIVCSIVIFTAFRYGFDLILPAGPLTNVLP